jgi:hypothetical protein
MNRYAFIKQPNKNDRKISPVLDSTLGYCGFPLKKMYELPQNMKFWQMVLSIGPVLFFFWAIYGNT